MGTENIVNQIENNLENLKSLEIEDIDYSNISSWNNLDQDDFLKSIDEIVNLLEESLELNIYDNYPFNIVNAVQNNLNKTIQQVQQFVNQSNQQNFTKAFQQVESYRTNLRNWGIYSYINFEFNIEEKIKSFNSDYQDILTTKREFEELRNNVQQLIEPAVSGSLSKSFSERKQDLKKNTRIWLIISTIAAIAAIGATYWVVNSLLGSLDIPDNATSEQIQDIIDGRPSYGLMNLLRLGILFPVYSFFLYAFNQYRKERNLEEEYAHRAAVATSLPNYGDLAVDTKVKDQIISSASNVVFRSPIEKKSSKSNESDDSNSLDKVQNILDRIGQLITKRGE